MTVFLVTFVVMALIIAAMSIGVLMGRKPITGSCGGVGAALNEKDYVCDLCGGDESKCEEKQEKISPDKASVQKSNASADLFYNADC